MLALCAALSPMVTSQVPSGREVVKPEIYTSLDPAARGSSFQIAVVMYSGKFIKERPKVARDFLHAYVEGVKLYNQRGPKDAEVIAIIAKHTKVSPDTVRASAPAYLDPSARPRVPDLAAFQDWYHTMGWVKEKVPIERVVDLTFLQ